jgi:HTH-type transcriptional regulator, sugar sensing transcriptional regulator
MDLRRFGFTSTESRVYLALLKVSPATGYTVAREAGLARANTYGALERLAARGIAARLPGRPARYLAADPASMTGRLDREWRRDLDALVQQLAAVERRDAQPAAPLLEILSDRSALLDRLASCARGAGEELLGVVGPWAADCFAELAGTGRTRAVRILSLGVPAPEGALVRPASPPEIAAYWGGLPVALVSDRRVTVLGLLFNGGLASGLATNHAAVVPFIRHLLRRELAAATSQRVS